MVHLACCRSNLWIGDEEYKDTEEVEHLKSISFKEVHELQTDTVKGLTIQRVPASGQSRMGYAQKIDYPAMILQAKKKRKKKRTFNKSITEDFTMKKQDDYNFKEIESAYKVAICRNPMLKGISPVSWL